VGSDRREQFAITPDGLYARLTMRHDSSGGMRRPASPAVSFKIQVLANEHRRLTCFGPFLLFF
jgi:hypothetical protein